MSPTLTELPLLSGEEMLRAQYSLRLMSCSVAVRTSGTSGVICAHENELQVQEVLHVALGRSHLQMQDWSQASSAHMKVRFEEQQNTASCLGQQPNAGTRLV